MKKLVFVMGAALLLQGCTYAISSDLVKQADRTIPFESLENDPESYKGKVVIVGGIIVQVSNAKETTLIEVTQKPLDTWGKPQRTDQTGGRFLILYRGYLNTLVYAPGRELTAAAEVQGTRRKSLGTDEQTLPVLLSKELKLWPRERPPQYRPDHLDPLYDPYASPRQY